MTLIQRFTGQIAAVAALGILIGCGSPETGGAKPNGTATNTSKGPETTPDATAAARPVSPGAGNKAGGNTLLIGMVASVNGELKPWGDDCVKGGQLAVEEVNAKGGIDGKKIDLRIGDSNSKPEQGKSAAEKLISDGVLGIVGEVASGITIQIAGSAFEKGIPVIAVGATRTDLTAKGNNIFRVCYTDAFQGPVMATFAYKDLGLRKVAMMTDKKQPYSTGLSDSFRKKFAELGGEIVDEQFYESGQTTFSGQLTNLKAKNPDGLFMSGYFTEVGPIARQAKDAGLNVKMLGGDGWDSSDLFTSGGEAIQGGYYCNHYSNKEQRPEVKDFITRWTAKFGKEPATAMGALGYDATMLMLDALKRAKTKDSKALIDAIADTTDFPGISGKVTLKGNGGDPPKRALIVQVGKGELIPAKAYEWDEVMKGAAAGSTGQK
ncbi:MAG: ABC transporter substrate-binding protein [Armatimonadetes bacterium]|nr:ABC transporter substrate-binding protein [Armatimonadota bacterium]